MEYITSKETVEVILPYSSCIFHSIMERPICDEINFYGIKSVIYIDKKTGEIIEWYWDGLIISTHSDGTMYKWYPRPTLKNVILMKPASYYTQFHSNGAVTQILTNNNSWVWGPKNISKEEIITDISYKYELDDCGCHNNFRCCGYNPYDKDY
jgi:hypothetical protein